MEKRRSRIGAMSSEQFDSETQLGREVYCSTQSRPPTANCDCGFVDRNPLALGPRRVVTAVNQLMYPLPNRLTSAVNAEQAEVCFSN
jgi:hypothetical protein